MAEQHVFDSPLVEEFYNSCHYKANGRFCGGKTRGRDAKRVPMSDAARASNAALRAKSAKARKKMAAKQAQSKGAMEKMGKAASKVVTVKPKYAADKFGSGKTDPNALSLTQKYGTRARPTAKTSKVDAAPKTVAPKAKAKEQYGSGKTEPKALALTQKYGTRRRTDDAGKPYVIDPAANRKAANAQIAKAAPSGKSAYKGSKTPAQKKAEKERADKIVARNRK